MLAVMDKTREEQLLSPQTGHLTTDIVGVLKLHPQPLYQLRITFQMLLQDPIE